MIDLSTKICKVKFSNPCILASGILGMTASSLINIVNHGASGVVTKSVSLKPRKGHVSPSILSLPGAMINAVGLSNAGLNEFGKEIKDFKSRCQRPLIVSIFASTVKEFGELAKKVSAFKPDFLEINISCPNVENEFGLAFGTDPRSAAQVTSEVKKNTSLPIIVKLTPNVANIIGIAQAVEKAGADAIAAINTVGPGMIIDLETRQPILANKMGGISGPAIKSIAVRCVYQIAQAVKIPIIGVGGLSKGEDVIEIMMAGAQAVEIGSAVYARGPDVFRKINQEIEGWLKKHHHQKVKEIIGQAHG
jgi:dihydroorotate dehydrogenase (NAD+) catalytic subunit